MIPATSGKDGAAERNGEDARGSSKKAKIGELGEVVPLAAPEQRVFGKVAVPAVVRCSKADTTPADVAAWVTANQQAIEALLQVHGGILFRGFPLANADHFDAFVSAFDGFEDLSYKDSMSFAVRLQVTGRVCTTNEGKKGGQVFHHEQAQTPFYPSKLFFFCEQPATTGGGTAICPSDVIVDRIKAEFPDFYTALKKHGVKYTAYMATETDATKGAGRSWKSFFGCDTVDAVEARMKELGYTWEWLDDKTTLAATSPVLSGIRVAPGSEDREVFFNQIVATLANASQFSGSATEGAQDLAATLSKFITFGNGKPMKFEVLDAIREMCEAVAVELEWQTGDVALLDNFLVMHARREFDGPRRVLASLVK